jgi:hypothetical protein
VALDEVYTLYHVEFFCTMMNYFNISPILASCEVGGRVAQLVWRLVYGMEDWISITRSGRDLFLFSAASRPALGPESLSPGVKRPGREADHSHPSSAEAKSEWSYTSTPPVHLHDVVLR